MVRGSIYESFYEVIERNSCKYICEFFWIFLYFDLILER